MGCDGVKWKSKRGKVVGGGLRARGVAWGGDYFDAVCAQLHSANEDENKDLAAPRLQD